MPPDVKPKAVLRKRLLSEFEKYATTVLNNSLNIVPNPTRLMCDKLSSLFSDFWTREKIFLNPASLIYRIHSSARRKSPFASNRSVFSRTSSLGSGEHFLPNINCSYLASNRFRQINRRETHAAAHSHNTGTGFYLRKLDEGVSCPQRTHVFGESHFYLKIKIQNLHFFILGFI